MPKRHELTDAQWDRLKPLLPPHKPGRRRQDDRRVLNAILWKLATGAPWRDLPERRERRQERGAPHRHLDRSDSRRRRRDRRDRPIFPAQQRRIAAAGVRVDRAERRERDVHDIVLTRHTERRRIISARGAIDRARRRGR